MFSTILNTLIAISAFGGLALGALNLWNARSKTSVSFRWELDHECSDVPYLLSSDNFESSLRKGLAYLLPGADDIYGQPVSLLLIVRVDRRGTAPVTVEYIELGDYIRRTSLERQPGNVGSAVRIIHPNCHFEWAFDFGSVARQLSYANPSKDFPDVAIRLANGGTQKGRFLKAPVISAAEIRTLMHACQNVWPN